MIYVSSSCSKQKRIDDAIEEFVSAGIRNIELSGGTDYYVGYEDDILRLQDKYNLNLLVHNYFPPPKENFVLNLASLDDEIYIKSIQSLCRSIQLSHKIGAKRFGFHAGFFVDMNIKELGSLVEKKIVEKRELSIKRFCEAFKKLQEESRGLDLYIENNIYSYSNYQVFCNQLPFMLLTYKDYSELKKLLNFKLLLDLAHLKVTINTLQLNFDEEFDRMISESDYLHISENNGKHDQNLEFNKKSDLVRILGMHNLRDKTITIEVYSKTETIVQSRDILSSIIDGSNHG
jgi:sugar phosphate isomerase/epimerase